MNKPECDKADKRGGGEPKKKPKKYKFRCRDSHIHTHGNFYKTTKQKTIINKPKIFKRNKCPDKAL